MKPESKMEVRLISIQYLARNINAYAFSRVDGGSLPTVSPGAHIDLHLPNGLVRQYSLIETGGDPLAYRVAIKREEKSRGGSHFIFDQLKVGDRIRIGQPRNNFALAEPAARNIFIAGGIGITPIHAMIRRLSELGKPWEFYYACRTRAELPALDLVKPCPNTHLHIDDEAGGALLDLGEIVASAGPDTHLYCCGPAAMLSAFEATTQNRLASYVHVEYFSAKDAPPPSGGFTIRLARSDKEFVVPAGQTILGVLRQAGVDVAFSCEEGVCGACETTVLSGVPEHHDAILTESERAANTTMMICCGGARSDTLVLDL